MENLRTSILLVTALHAEWQHHSSSIIQHLAVNAGTSCDSNANAGKGTLVHCGRWEEILIFVQKHINISNTKNNPLSLKNLWG
jgi:hypothetical protein